MTTRPNCCHSQHLSSPAQNQAAGRDHTASIHRTPRLTLIKSYSMVIGKKSVTKNISDSDVKIYNDPEANKTSDPKMALIT